MGMKQTEVGMIPEEWTVQSFSDTFRILNNNTFSRASLNYVSGRFRNIHYGDVLILFPEVLDCTRDDVPYINDETRISGSAQALQDGDIVMADTAEDETVGKVTEVMNTSEKPVMSGLHTIPCRVKAGEFAPKWLGYYMNSHLYHDLLLPYIHGTKVSSVSKGSLGGTAIIVPSTEEQKKIIKALSDIDTLIVDLQKLIRKKKDIRQGTMQMLVTGKKRLNGYSKKWKEYKLKNISSIQDGTHGTFKRTDNGYMLLSAKNVFDNHLVLSDEESFVSEDDYYSIVSNGYPQKGDILMSCVGTIGRCCIYDAKEKAAFQRSVAIIRCNSTCSNRFVSYVLQTEDVYKQLTAAASASAQVGIYLGALNEIEIRIPDDLREQDEIACIINDMNVEIDVLEEKISKYQKVKQGMMEELLTGKVRLI